DNKWAKKAQGKGGLSKPTLAGPLKGYKYPLLALGEGWFSFGSNLLPISCVFVEITYPSVNNHYTHSKTPQPKRNVGRQNQPAGFPVTWNNFQHQSYIGKCVLHFHVPINYICLKVDLEPNEWIKDSECSKNMTVTKSSSPLTRHTTEVTPFLVVIFMVTSLERKTPYELLRGRKPTLDYFRVFGSKCFILNTKDYHTKFDPKSYEGVFLGYTQNSKAYIILNKHTRKIEESLTLTFDETPPPFKTSSLVDNDLDEEEAIKVTERKTLENDIEDETLEIDEIFNIKKYRNHPLENVIGNQYQRTLRSQAQNQSNFFCFISTIEHKNVNEALTDES
nr:retrovirus-related Pol polyprotein from transposon TNT 1-94 [Tanacetum cinerariifolium]